MQERIGERRDFYSRYSGCTFWSSKVICGKCGSVFGPRPWHSTTTNDLAWQCRKRVQKKEKCRIRHIYDKHLHYLVHDAGRRILEQRCVDIKVIRILQEMLPEKRMSAVRESVKKFLYGEVWQLCSDEEDLAVIIRSMTVCEDDIMRFRFLDDTEMTYQLQKFSPRRGFYE